MEQEAAPGLGMSLAALGDWFAGALPDLGAPIAVSKFGQGQSNPTYRVACKAGRVVLRSKPPGPLLPSAHLVEREYRAMAALGPTAVPVPRMLALATDAASPSGRAFFVMEHLDGRILFDPALPELPEPERGAVYAAMAEALAALHEVDVAAVGLSDFGKPGDYFGRQLARWDRQYRMSVADPLPDMLALADWLGAHAPADDGQVALVHGDWRLDNLMLAPDAPRIIGVLDWELATLGHPMADLAYQCMAWRLPREGGLRGLGDLDRTAHGLPTEAEYVAAYASARGLSGVSDWEAWLVLAFFRLAAILAGVAARAEAGNASNPETARVYGRAVPSLAAMALEITRQGAEPAEGGR